MFAGKPCMAPPRQAAVRGAAARPPPVQRTSCAWSCRLLGSLCTSPKMVTRALASPVHLLGGGCDGAGGCTVSGW